MKKQKISKANSDYLETMYQYGYDNAMKNRLFPNSIDNVDTSHMGLKFKAAYQMGWDAYIAAHAKEILQELVIGKPK